MKQWLYLLRPVRPEMVTDPTPEETDAVERHFRRLQAMLADGRLILAGRTQEENPLGGCPGHHGGRPRRAGRCDVGHAAPLPGRPHAPGMNCGRSEQRKETTEKPGHPTQGCPGQVADKGALLDRNSGSSWAPIGMYCQFAPSRGYVATLRPLDERGMPPSLRCEGVAKPPAL